ncbi:hypothetical protein BDV96DRAFT_654167 [Lophiotrema nucula]|uniref:Uncharacterized protein n=1 Tax=Lophiotrema nucula TaxID=690887 RepID=A0A6A5YIK4_9PLEO|nr:hypothetical protein BDV96DRAFT_654167 [Lophiotrema nucula]
MSLFDKSPTLAKQAQAPIRRDTTFLDNVLKNKLVVHGVLKSVTQDSLIGDVLQKICDWFGITGVVRRRMSTGGGVEDMEMEMQVLHNLNLSSHLPTRPHHPLSPPTPPTDNVASLPTPDPHHHHRHQPLTPEPTSPAVNPDEIDNQSLFFYTPASSFTEAATLFQTYRRSTPEERRERRNLYELDLPVGDDGVWREERRGRERVVLRRVAPRALDED